MGPICDSGERIGPASGAKGLLFRSETTRRGPGRTRSPPWAGALNGWAPARGAIGAAPWGPGVPADLAGFRELVGHRASSSARKRPGGLWADPVATLGRRPERVGAGETPGEGCHRSGAVGPGVPPISDFRDSWEPIRSPLPGWGGVSRTSVSGQGAHRRAESMAAVAPPQRAPPRPAPGRGDGHREGGHRSGRKVEVGQGRVTSGGADALNRYSRSALPRRILYLTSSDRWAASRRSWASLIEYGQLVSEWG